VRWKKGRRENSAADRLHRLLIRLTDLETLADFATLSRRLKIANSTERLWLCSRSWNTKSDAETWPQHSRKPSGKETYRVTVFYSTRQPAATFTQKPSSSFGNSKKSRGLAAAKQGVKSMLREEDGDREIPKGLFMGAVHIHVEIRPADIRACLSAMTSVRKGGGAVPIRGVRNNNKGRISDDIQKI